METQNVKMETENILSLSLTSLQPFPPEEKKTRKTKENFSLPGKPLYFFFWLLSQ
jgi:hypothetical protein